MDQLKDIVFPGDIIAKEEEYVSGKNTQDVDGDVISTAFGKVARDDKALVISVNTTRQSVPVKKYDIVYGKVIKLLNKEAIVLVSGFVRDGQLIPANTETRIRLPIPNKTMYSHIVTLGDLVRARIISTRPSYSTIFDNGLGVLKSRCTICRNELTLENGKLMCRNCGRIEQRKLAPDYGNINILGDNHERS